LTLKDRFAEVSITLFFWLLLLYMWQPLVSFFAWMFQGYVSYQHMFYLGGYHAVLAILKKYLLIITSTVGVLFLWALYNQWRFRGKERRKAVPDTLLLEHALYCNVDARDVLCWRQYKQMVVTFGEGGYISGATEGALHDVQQAGRAPVH